MIQEVKKSFFHKQISNYFKWLKQKGEVTYASGLHPNLPRSTYGLFPFFRFQFL